MRTTYSAQGSATVKRLRNGDTLYLTLEGNGIALFQGIDPTALSPTPTPSWKVAANQPMLTPKVTSARGNTVTITNHQWKYNGTALIFNGAIDADFTKDSTGKFEMNASTGALKIIDDIASASNYGNDVLTYSCTVKVGELSYNFTRDRDISIVRMGAGIYTAVLVASAMQIGDGETSTIKSYLYAGTELATDYYIRWFKNGEDSELTKFAGSKNVTITRDDVDGSTLFIAKFYSSSTSTQVIARAVQRIIDNKDEFQVNFVFVSDNRTVDAGKPVTMKGQVINTTTNSVMTLTNPKWKITVMDTQNWKEIRTVENTDSVTVTTEDTDRTVDGVEQQNDVELIGEVEFNV